MSAAVRYDIIADRGCHLDERLAKVGVDWTGATMFLQVREVPDATGSPILNFSLGAGLALVYGGTDTLANHVAAGRVPRSIYQLVNPVTGVNYAAADSVAMSVVALIVEASGLVSPIIPYPEERGDNWIGAYDLLVDADAGGSGTAAKHFFGTFTVRGTVTIP